MVMRVLFVSHSSGLLGAERSLLEIVREAVDIGLDVGVVMPARGPLADGLMRLEVPIYYHRARSWLGRWHHLGVVGAVRLFQIWFSLERERMLLLALRPDIVVTNTSVTPGFAMACRRLGVPHVWIVRESLEKNRQLHGLISKRAIARRIVLSSDAVCVVSRFVGDQLSRLSGQELDAVRITPRPSVVITDRGRTVGRCREEHHTLRLLMAGYFSAEKGQLLALRAMRILRKAGNQRVNLTIVGRGGPMYAHLLRAYVRAFGLRGQVAIESWCSEMGVYYSNADATLMLSSSEAYGRVTAESLLYGIPVLAHVAGATAEILRNGGGIPLKDRSPQSISTAIEKMIEFGSEDWERLGLAAYECGVRIAAGPSQFEMLLPALRIAARRPKAQTEDVTGNRHEY